MGVWWKKKLEKNDKVRHNKIQISSLLAVATVFIGLWTLLSSYILLSGSGVYTQDETTYAGTWAKSVGGGGGGGGLMYEGRGRNCGIL